MMNTNTKSRRKQGLLLITLAAAGIASTACAAGDPRMPSDPALASSLAKAQAAGGATTTTTPSKAAGTAPKSKSGSTKGGAGTVVFEGFGKGTANLVRIQILDQDTQDHTGHGDLSDVAIPFTRSYPTIPDAASYNITIVPSDPNDKVGCRIILDGQEVISDGSGNCLYDVPAKHS